MLMHSLVFLCIGVVFIVDALMYALIPNETDNILFTINLYHSLG